MRRRPVLRGTVWDKSLLLEVPARFRALYTVCLPLNYGLLALFGLAGLVSVVAPVAQVTSVGYGTIWTMVIGAAAAVSFAGLASRKESLELYASIALVIVMSTYPIVDAFLLLTGDFRHASLAFGLFTFIILPTWRVFDLVHVLRLRLAASKAAALKKQAE